MANSDYADSTTGSESEPDNAGSFPTTQHQTPQGMYLFFLFFFYLTYQLLILLVFYLIGQGTQRVLTATSPALHSSQSQLLQGQPRYIDLSELERTLLCQRDWITTQLTNTSLPTSLFTSFQTTGHQIKRDLISQHSSFQQILTMIKLIIFIFFLSCLEIANGTYENDPHSLVQVRLTNPFKRPRTSDTADAPPAKRLALETGENITARLTSQGKGKARATSSSSSTPRQNPPRTCQRPEPSPKSLLMPKTRPSPKSLLMPKTRPSPKQLLNANPHLMTCNVPLFQSPGVDPAL